MIMCNFPDAESESAYQVPEPVAAYGESHYNIDKQGSAIQDLLGPDSAVSNRYQNHSLRLQAHNTNSVGL